MREEEQQLQKLLIFKFELKMSDMDDDMYEDDYDLVSDSEI